jgi:hypothetical protein
MPFLRHRGGFLSTDYFAAQGGEKHTRGSSELFPKHCQNHWMCW